MSSDLEIVEVERIAQGADGIAHLADGRVVFVERALPGERVEIELIQSRKRWARARVRKILTPVPERLEPDCPHFAVCGGCAFRHTDYDTELAAKTEAARQTIARISKLEIPDGEVVAAEPPDGYRIRARMHIDGGHLGYYAAGSRDVFAVRECPVLDPRLGRAIAALSAAVSDIARGELLFEAAGPDEIVVELRTDGDPGGALEKLAAIDGVRGAEAGAEIRGRFEVDGSEVLGIDAATSLAGGRFRQAHGPMTPALRELVRQRCQRGQHLVELFAGSGSFALHLAGAFDAIAAYELDSEAVAIGNSMAKDLGIPHVRFETLDLNRNLPPIPEGATVLLDPPRTGAKFAAESLAETNAGRIVYVSCDPATLARDLAQLGRQFELETLDLVDMFGRTAHLEAVATLIRKSARSPA